MSVSVYFDKTFVSFCSFVDPQKKERKTENVTSFNLIIERKSQCDLLGTSSNEDIKWKFKTQKISYLLRFLKHSL